MRSGPLVRHVGFKQTPLTRNTKIIRNNSWILIITIGQPNFDNTEILFRWNSDAINTGPYIGIFRQTFSYQTIW